MLKLSNLFVILKNRLVGGDVLEFQDLRSEADYDLARRSISGMFSFFLPWLIIYNATGIEQLNKVLLEFLGFILAATSIGRLYLSLNFKNFYAINPRIWRVLFSTEAITSATVWSGVCVIALSEDGLSSTSVMVMLSTAVIAAGSIVTLAPSRRLGGVFIVLLFSPIVPFLLLSDIASKKAIGLLFLTYFMFMFLMWYRLHAEYWQALSVRAELRRAKVAAEEANAAKGIFIASVSHELRTPLTSVIGSLGMIVTYMSDGLTQETRTLVDMAYQNGKRLSVLINDILDFEKLSAHRMEFNYQWLLLTPFLNKAIELNQAFADDYSVSLILKQPNSDVKINTDEQRLMQVMTNLLSNAAKHSPVGEEVLITVELNTDAVKVSVKNKGEGIPEFFRHRIFEKFAQADNSGARKNNGTGLGLAISKEIIDQMGGEINFISESGQGATFYFNLPLALNLRQSGVPQKN
jgi:signal transduction histidine kinase